MSRIGKLPIAIPADVTVDIQEGNIVAVKGPLGSLTQQIDKGIVIKKEDNNIVLERPNDSKKYKSLHGLSRSLVFNMVEGVKNGFEKKLEINGVGYRAALEGTKLVLNLGYSNPIEVNPLVGVSFEVPNANTVLVKGYDKQAVGHQAAQIRAYRKPEPYLGKGVKYADEVIRRKEGKSGA